MPTMVMTTNRGIDMIDLHSHLLPGVDDGAQTFEEALYLADLAVKEGIRQLIVTPHHRNHRYLNHGNDVCEATEHLAHYYQQNGISLQIRPAQEIRLNENLLDDIYSGDVLALDEEGKYFLIEFSTRKVPDYAYPLFKAMIVEGMIPVIAHPERQHIFAKDLNKLYEFIQIGCIGQLTASSYIGAFGSELKRVSQQMIEHNLVHIIASDAHNTTNRLFNMKKAYQQLESEYGKRKAIYFQENARCVWDGEDGQWALPKKKKRWFNLF